MAGNELRRREATARLDDGQALTAFTTTVRENGTATLGGFAGTKTDLAGALFAVRAECRFHDFENKRGSQVPDGAGGVKGGV